MNPTGSRHRIRTSALTRLFLFTLLYCPIVLAQPPNPDSQPSPTPVTSPEVKKEQPPNPATAQPTPCAVASDAAVTGVSPKDVELGEVIVLQGEFKNLIAQAKCEKKDIVLYLEQRPLKDITAYPPSDPAGTTLSFPLKRTEQSRDVWTYLLGKPSWPPRKTGVSVGLADKFAVPSEQTINLAVIPHGWFIFWLFVLLGLIALFLILAIKSDLLRDSVQVIGEGERKPFSLARTQAAWWFFLVLASYLFIGMITGDFNTTITTTVLGLIGISAGTVVSSAMIDASKNTPAAAATNSAAIQEIQAQINQLDQEIAAANQALLANPQDVDAATNKSLKTQEKEMRGSQLKKLKNQSENPLLDILSDANGVSFHRFQIVAWTLVLGIIFISQVYSVLAMPEFNGSLLALLGISAGTFVGLKIPEPTVPK